MVAAETMTGRDGLTAHALPHGRLEDVLRQYGRWVDPASQPRAATVTPPDLEAFVGQYESSGPLSSATIALEGDVLTFVAGPTQRRIVRLTNGEWTVLGTDLGIERTASRVRLTRAGEEAFELDRIGE